MIARLPTNSDIMPKLCLLLYNVNALVSHNEVMKAYLSQFDYLPASPVSLVDEYDDDADLEASLREPLRIFQRFFRLQETGEMNEESIQAIKRPRCGLGDPPPSDQNESRRGKRYALSGARWGKQELTFSVINTPTYNVMPRKKVNWAIWNALKMWSSVIPVSFRKVPSWQPADIVIKFASYYHGDSYPFDGPNGTIAHAYLPNGRFGDLDGDIHLDDSEAFNNHGRWGYNLYKVLAHEFGHSLGLDHSAVPGSIMVPDYQGFSEKPFTLHSDDIRAVQNNRVWMINKSGKLKTKALGMRSKKLFAGIPSSIDGGYQRPSDGNTVIFKDMQYYVYSGSNQLNGYPRPVADYSLTTESMQYYIYESTIRRTSSKMTRLLEQQTFRMCLLLWFVFKMEQLEQLDKRKLDQMSQHEPQRL
ncbi:putative matrix metalloproteinase-14 [Apostichopus japonicus]|uniref:Putative matrix metalloproteinase-14 n=1 Tax=Stichopus japonicus TaxID=307972 RepID=A0A2G8KDS3_STIJA|nr:putative matrix metalloproteinase-14 [Apostichopus japonicus]